MAIDKKAYALANGYTDETVIGGGAIKGKNCTISKIEDIDGGHRITFNWTLDNGTTKSQTLDVKDGVDGHTPVKGVDYFDGQKGEPGISGSDGKDGKDGITYTPSIGEVTTVESDVEASASVSVNTETKEAVFNFAIPKGKDGDRNADTVNNHTVESDVPVDAVFTDTIYDDTEVNAKLGRLSDSINGFENVQIVSSLGSVKLKEIIQSEFPKLKNGRGMIKISDDTTLYCGTYIKYSNTQGSVTFTNVEGTSYIWTIRGDTVTLQELATMDKLTATNSYFFGGRTYATYLSPHLLQKALGLPDAFKKYDVNNFYVSVTPEYPDGSHVEKPFIQKDTGYFSVNFKSDDGIFNENSAVWFDYIVVINH